VGCAALSGRRVVFWLMYGLGGGSVAHLEGGVAGELGVLLLQRQQRGDERLGHVLAAEDAVRQGRSE